MRSRTPRPSLRHSPGFTLVEILLSTALTAILMLVCVSAMNQTQKSWQQTKGKSEQFREARLAFELITRNVSQSTLNVYWDYFYTSTGSNTPGAGMAEEPAAYVRHSELQWLSGPAIDLLDGDTDSAVNPGHAIFFQAPLGYSLSHGGMSNLLNARGYYVKFSDDAAVTPPFMTELGRTPKYRYRLMEYRPPSEKISAPGQTAYQGNTIYTKPETWHQEDIEEGSRPVADNILLVLISPRVTKDAAEALKRDTTWIAPKYAYNSLDPDNASSSVDAIKINSKGEAQQGTQHLLPPLLAVTMVAVDEASMERWSSQIGDDPVDIVSESGADFDDPGKQEEEMTKLKTYLTEQKLNYRVFTATVPMRNAKWDGRAS